MPTSRVAVQVKLSARKAGLSASVVLLACLVMLPVRALINRALRGNWGTIDWRISIEIIGIISALWFSVMFVSNLLDLRTSDYRQETPNPSFGATAFIRMIYSACVGMSVLLFWGLGKQHEPVWMQWLSLSFSLLAFFGWPRTITLDEVGISQRSLFGVRRTIPYRTVECLSYERGQQTTHVVGIGATISHTGVHSDAGLFQSLMEERTGKKVQG